MRKKTLAVIISLAMTAALFAGLTVTASADTSEYGYFNIFVTDADTPDADSVVQYKTFTKDQYEAMAESGSAMGAAYFGKGAETVIKSSKYVNVDELLAKQCALDSSNIDKLYATDIYKEALEIYAKCTYEGYLKDGGYFYGSSVPGADFIEPGTEMKLALSATYAKVSDFTGYATIGDVLKADLTETDGINMLCPSKDLTDSAGSRICQGMNGICVNVNEQALLNRTKASKVKVAKKKTRVYANNAYAKLLKAENQPLTYKYYALKKGTKSWKLFGTTKDVNTVTDSKVFTKGAKNKYYKYKIVATDAKDGTVSKTVTTKYYKFKK